MKKYIIINLFVLFIIYGCTSADQKRIQQQYVEASDSVIIAKNDYINIYLSIIEKHHLAIINKIDLNEKDTIKLIEALDLKEKKIDSLEKITYNLRHMISVPLLEFYFWSLFTFYNASVRDMQVEFCARLMNARIKLTEEAFYILYIKSYSKFIKSFNKEINKRDWWLKILGLYSNKEYLKLIKS